MLEPARRRRIPIFRKHVKFPTRIRTHAWPQSHIMLSNDVTLENTHLSKERLLTLAHIRCLPLRALTLLNFLVSKVQDADIFYESISKLMCEATMTFQVCKQYK